MLIVLVLVLSVSAMGCLTTTTIIGDEVGDVLVTVEGGERDKDVKVEVCDDRYVLYHTNLTISGGSKITYAISNVSVGVYYVKVYYDDKLQEQNIVEVETGVVLELYYKIR